jgi:hypothetical protein
MKFKKFTTTLALSAVLLTGSFGMDTVETTGALVPYGANQQNQLVLANPETQLAILNQETQLVATNSPSTSYVPMWLRAGGYSLMKGAAKRLIPGAAEFYQIVDPITKGLGYTKLGFLLEDFAYNHDALRAKIVEKCSDVDTQSALCYLISKQAKTMLTKGGYAEQVHLSLTAKAQEAGFPTITHMIAGVKVSVFEMLDNAPDAAKLAHDAVTGLIKTLLPNAGPVAISGSHFVAQNFLGEQSLTEYFIHSIEKRYIAAVTETPAQQTTEVKAIELQ